jgi:Transcriptional regulator containing PAS, AAA-type ATPase, and DNA-binding domains
MPKQVSSNGNGGRIQDKIDFLREATAALLAEVKSLQPLKTLDVGNGIDFDEEVKRFEIFLIERALEKTGGSQLRAAQLLNIKHTTLNAKIKRYHILANSRHANGKAL